MMYIYTCNMKKYIQNPGNRCTLTEFLLALNILATDISMQPGHFVPNKVLV